MRALLLAALAAATFASVTLGNAPASAQGIYQGGSSEPGLVPWRGRTSLGPWGIQRHYGGGGYRYGGPVYYRGGYSLRYGYRSRGYAYKYATPVPRIVRYGGTCYRAGVTCPCPPRRYARRHYSPRTYRPAPVIATKPVCSTCAGSTIVQEQNKVQMGNIGANATVTINQTGTQQAGTPPIRNPGAVVSQRSSLIATTEGAPRGRCFAPAGSAHAGEMGFLWDDGSCHKYTQY